MAIELYSVIKNDGPAGLLYWHFQGENFRTGSQLVVAENEEALFVREGVVVETFSGGRFTLTTNNYPFIDRIRAFFSGGENAFTCNVCFVNKADALELKWGTDAPIAVRDPLFGVMTKVQGRGAFTIRVRNAKQFYLKFVGNNVQAVTEEAIRQRFRSATLQKVKTLIGKTILASGMEVLAVLADLDALAERLTPGLAEILDEYGLELVNFYIGALEIPDDDPSRAILEAKIAEAAANRAEIQMLGTDWQRVQGRDILMRVAENEGAAGEATGMGAGLGMGMAAGSAFGAMANAVFSPFAQPTSQGTPAPPSAPPISRFTPKAAPAEGAGTPTSGAGAVCVACHAPLPDGARFCPACGAKREAPAPFCAGCGKQLQPGARFCPWCGAKNA